VFLPITLRYCTGEGEVDAKMAKRPLKKKHRKTSSVAAEVMSVTNKTHVFWETSGKSAERQKRLQKD